MTPHQNQSAEPTFPISPVGSARQRNTVAQLSRWSLKAQWLTRSIQTQRDSIEIGLAMD
jgi:hypothetical protein